jgi:hypothetical protein
MAVVLLSNSSVLSHSVDVTPFVEESFDSIISKGNYSRREAFIIIALYLDNDEKVFHNKIFQVLERLSTILLNLLRADQDAFLDMIQAMANCVHQDILNAWNKNLNKFMTTLHRSLETAISDKDDYFVIFLCEILHRISHSHIRRLLVPHLKQTREFIYYFLFSIPSHLECNKDIELLLDCLASLNALESPIMFTALLNQLFRTMGSLLVPLSMISSSFLYTPVTLSTSSVVNKIHVSEEEDDLPHTANTTAIDDLPILFDIAKLLKPITGGNQKVLFIHRCFALLVKIVKKVIVIIIIIMSIYIYFSYLIYY